jgi:predicted lysophospholipase L1 biosynthesis ABC-type transport system permease subunit
MALILTVIGVSGVLSYSVSQRRNELAIRSALGAEGHHLRRLMFRDFAPPAMLGLIGGAWLAYLFAQTLRTQLYKLSPADPWVFGGVALTLLLLVLASAMRPITKAASISAAAIPRE